jgi:hypothetical protein
MKKRLYMKPRPAPKWWPRVNGRPDFVGVLKGGEGWCIGDGDLMTPAQITKAKWMLKMDNKNPLFEVR